MPEYRMIPNSAQFRRDIGGRGGQPLLIRICKQLDKYRSARFWRKPDKQLSALIELYFCTMQWLDSPPLLQGFEDSPAKNPHVEALFRATATRLGAHFGCKDNLNILPFRLEEFYGQRIQTDKWECDLGKREDLGPDDRQLPEHKDIATADANFLSKQELAACRLMFRNGLVYMWNWFEGGEMFEGSELQPVPANSQNAANPMVITPGFAGYAVRMDRAMFMTRQSQSHQEGGKVAHSTYTAGQAVLCAGEIAIADGRVICVTTASGHYLPTPEKLLHVLDLFVANGLNLSETFVGTKDANGRDQFFRARDFLSHRRQTNRLQPLTREQQKAMFDRIPGFRPGILELHKEWSKTIPDITVEQLLAQFY